MAIGIEAFNKFSQEQKAEMEEDEEEAIEDTTTQDASSEDNLSKAKFDVKSGKKFLKKVAVWTSAAFSSTRVN